MADDKFSPWGLWLFWVAANALALVAVWLLSYAVLALLKSLFSQVNEDHILGFIMLPIALLLPALLQWLVLRRYFRPASPWLVASVAGRISIFAVSFVTARVSGDFMAMILGPGFLFFAFGILGLALGAAQWFVLRRHVARAGWYILASMLGWATLNLVIGPTISNLAEMTAIGAVPALFTGAALAYLFGQAQPAETRLRQQMA